MKQHQAKEREYAQNEKQFYENLLEKNKQFY